MSSMTGMSGMYGMSSISSILYIFITHELNFKNVNTKIIKIKIIIKPKSY